MLERREGRKVKEKERKIEGEGGNDGRKREGEDTKATLAREVQHNLVE